MHKEIFWKLSEIKQSEDKTLNPKNFLMHSYGWVRVEIALMRCCLLYKPNRVFETLETKVSIESQDRLVHHRLPSSHKLEFRLIEYC